MDQIASVSAPGAPGLAKSWLLVATVVVAATAVSFLGVRWLASPPAADGTMPVSAPIEAAWGVRITHVVVTADGGLVEMRFLVLDSDRALAMMQDVANVPVLRVERTGELVRSAALMTGKHAVAVGRTGFLLYRNTDGAIKPGASVSVVFGPLELQHVPAQ
jgi:hypothetical protein